MNRLLRHCILIDVPTEHPVFTLEAESTQKGYSLYWEQVFEIFRARRSGGAVQFEPDVQLIAQLQEYIIRLRGWLDRIPPNLLPYFGGALSLPYKLLWTLIAVSISREGRDWCVPAAIYITEWIVNRQAHLVHGSLANSEPDERKRARSNMLAKLSNRRKTVRGGQA